MKIIPVVMEKEWPRAEARLENIWTTSPYVQIDVVDNEYAPGKSFEMELLNRFEWHEKMLWDIHLLVKEPLKWLEKCIHVGATRIIGQVEMMTDRESFISGIKDEGIEAGLGFDIDTPVGEIPLETDFVLLMSRKAGFVPATLDLRIVEKIKAAKRISMEREHQFLIGIDGGVNLENYKILEDAGADVVYSEKSYFELINEYQKN